jgi:hypothetical protein
MHRPFRADTLMHSAALCWLVLVALLFGMAASAVGAMHSHGLAVLAAVDHGTGDAAQDKVADMQVGTAHGPADSPHGHSHEDDDVTGSAGDPTHPHHAHDHSHDKAHMPPDAVAAQVPGPSAWRAVVRLQAERMPVFRLDRPPRIGAMA